MDNGVETWVVWFIILSFFGLIIMFLMGISAKNNISDKEKLLENEEKIKEKEILRQAKQKKFNNSNLGRVLEKREHEEKEKRKKLELEIQKKTSKKYY
tara:strand:+ start:734 stop:1027 length:294 start_codon:yes stop_codon:yes gene_type:complete